MSNVVSLAKYKRGKGISPPRSPYYALNATEKQLREAADQALELLHHPIDRSGRLPYAVLIGYEDEAGRTKLLKSFRVYPTRDLLAIDSGRQGLLSVFVTAEHRGESPAEP